MVGEIRDGETAEIAIKAAQTGHLVLSTLHTNSTTETLVRLQQMGVARWMISSALSMVIAQRLVRRLCPYCRQEASRHTELPARCGPAASSLATHRLRSLLPRFYGRVAIFEVLVIDDTLRQAIASGASTEVIGSSARQAGMTSLFEHGCMAVEQGLTTLEELLRVRECQMAANSLWRWRALTTEGRCKPAPSGPSTVTQLTRLWCLNSCTRWR